MQGDRAFRRESLWFCYFPLTYKPSSKGLKGRGTRFCYFSLTGKLAAFYNAKPSHSPHMCHAQHAVTKSPLRIGKHYGKNDKSAPA